MKDYEVIKAGCDVWQGRYVCQGQDVLPPGLAHEAARTVESSDVKWAHSTHHRKSSRVRLES